MNRGADVFAQERDVDEGSVNSSLRVEKRIVRAYGCSQFSHRSAGM
jgi:hypothetical protein